MLEQRGERDDAGLPVRERHVGAAFSADQEARGGRGGRRHRTGHHPGAAEALAQQQHRWRVGACRHIFARHELRLAQPRAGAVVLFGRCLDGLQHLEVAAAQGACDDGAVGVDEFLEQREVGRGARTDGAGLRRRRHQQQHQEEEQGRHRACDDARQSARKVRIPDLFAHALPDPSPYPAPIMCE